MISALNNGVLIGILLDVIVVITLLIAVVFGVKRGLLKMLRGLLSTVLVIVVAVFLVSPITKLVADQTEWDDQLSYSLTVSLNNSLQFAEPNTSLYYFTEDAPALNKDGEPVWGVVYQVSENAYASVDTLGTTFAQKMAIKFLIVPSAESYLSKSTQENPSVLLINSAANNLTMIIISAAAFVLLMIVLMIVLKIVFFFLKKLVSNFYIAHFFDRTLGAVLGVAIGAIVIYLLVAILKALSGNAYMDMVNFGIENSFITRLIYDNNHLAEYLANVSIFKTIDDALGGLFRGGGGTA